MCPYASCNDCCIVHSTSAGADPELVGGGGGWSCMLLLHPVPTCADAGPDLCTLHPDLAPCACSSCHRQQLLVVIFLPQMLTQTPLAPAVVSPIATCAGGVFSSIYWRRYWPYTQATCTVWWWLFGGICIYKNCKSESNVVNLVAGRRSNVDPVDHHPICIVALGWDHHSGRCD